MAQKARFEVFAELKHRPYPMIAASVSCYGAFTGHEYDGDYGGISDDDLAKYQRI